MIRTLPTFAGYPRFHVGPGDVTREPGEKFFAVLGVQHGPDRAWPWNTPVRLARCGCCGAVLGRVTRADEGPGPCTHLQTVPGFTRDKDGAWRLTAHRRGLLRQRGSYGRSDQLVAREWLQLPQDIRCPGRSDQWGRPGQAHLQRVDGERLRVH
jgi:hypothetical protein